jgi:hypothetical protein
MRQIQRYVSFLQYVNQSSNTFSIFLSDIPYTDYVQNIS